MRVSERTIVRKYLKNLLGHGKRRFQKPRGTICAPDKQGVYVIHGPTGKVLHVGSTYRGKKGLAQRLRNHIANQSSFATKYLKGRGTRLRRGYTFRLVEIPEPRMRALVEAMTVGLLRPAHIGLHQTKAK